MIKEIDGIISLFKERFPEGSVLMTGGDSLLFADAIENDIFADPLLTLKGLYGILQFNNA
jgi:type III pantothenate kinase